MIGLTIVEAINVIVRLYMPLSGYWKDEIDNIPEAQKMLYAGYLCLDEEYGDKYLINNKGKDAIHPYIKGISEDFIKFMKKQGYQCPANKVHEWFTAKYQLSTPELGGDIGDYICKNLTKYGYTAYLPHPNREDGYIRIEPLWK